MVPGGRSRPGRPSLPAPSPSGYFSRVRTLLASALVLLACGCADRSSRPSGAGALSSIPSGPDPVVLRVPRSGGIVSARPYPAIDSVLWRSTQRVPPLAQVLAFGPDDGHLAAIDSTGAPVRLDLRLGVVTTGRRESMRRAASADGGTTYGVRGDGSLGRISPIGSDWTMAPPGPVDALLPQPDGSLVVAGARDDAVVVWRVRPPGTEVGDELVLETGGTARENGATIAATAATVGDRVVLAAHESVLAVETRGFTPVMQLRVGDPVTAVVSTPSGDRLFVATRDDRTIRVIDRYAADVSRRIRLPGVPRALRIDPLGRTLLARGDGDSVWVVTLATGAVVGSLTSRWRDDLPAVLPDGQVAVVRDDDVVFVDGGTLAETRTVDRGALDRWVVLRWNGFRPRAAGLDVPVQFRASEPREVPPDLTGADAMGTGPGEGSTGAPPDDSTRSVRDSSTRTAASEAAIATVPTRVDSTVAEAGFVVQFAALLDRQSAEALASGIRVDGRQARISTTQRDGRALYRVVLGPYATRAQAERAGRAAGVSFWISEGTP